MLRLKNLSILFIALLYLNVHSAAQALTNVEIQAFKNLEDSLVSLAHKMLRATDHSDRVTYGFDFSSTLKFTLEQNGSFYYPFNDLKNTIHIESPEDQSFKIFNWLVAPSETIRRYYGVIQTPDQLFFLRDPNTLIDEDFKTKTLDIHHWYGNEIYRLQPYTYKKETIYLWYGINTDGPQTNKKSLDVLYFKEGVPYFGLPIFEFPTHGNTQNLKLYHRLIWDYSKLTGFTLNYDEDRHMILFDRLQSVVNEDKRRNTYAPSGQTQGLEWDKGIFKFKEEAIPILQLKDGGAPVDGVFPGR